MTRDEILMAHPLLPWLEQRGVKLTANRTRAARCPLKEHTRQDNVSLAEAKGVWRCHACNVGGTVIDWLALEKGIKPAQAMRELAGSKGQRRAGNGIGAIVATFDFTDEQGNILFQEVKYQPKHFKQRRPDGKCGWIWNMEGVRLVPYRLPDLIAAPEVWIVEGPKDCESMRAAGFVATTNPMGAGKWRQEFNECFRGKTVFIIPDNDKDGRTHADTVARSLHSIAASVKVLALPNLPPKGDVSDFIATFADKAEAAERLAVIAEGAPEYQPTPEPANISTAETGKDVAGWIRGEIVGALTNSNLDGWQKRQQIAGSVVSALAKVGKFYFHASRRDFESALFFNAQSKRLERIGSDAFGAWLSAWLAVNRAEPLFKNIFSEVQTAALTGPLTSGIEPELFWASRPGAVYLSNGDGQLVKIAAQGVTLADNGSDGVLFAAGRTLAPWALTTPRDPLAACSLFASVNCIATHGKDLLRLWIYSLPTNPRSKPPLSLSGDVRSGKTRTAKGIAEFYGVPFVCAKVQDNGEDDFWPGLDAGGLFTLDNADTHTRWLADALAAAATDGCSQRRKLYTNSENVILRARAWLAITSANPSFAADAGLADRLLVVRLGRRAGTTSDAALSDEIAAARDAGLSHITATLSKALADTEPTPAGLNARHPDFAAFAVKIGRALGREAEAVAALKAAEADKSAFCLENDNIGSALLAYVRSAGSFEGTAAILAERLQEVDPDLRDRLSAKRLGKRLSALWPHLQAALATAKRETDRKGFTVFRFKADTSAEFAEFQAVIS